MFNLGFERKCEFQRDYTPNEVANLLSSYLPDAVGENSNRSKVSSKTPLQHSLKLKTEVSKSMLTDDTAKLARIVSPDPEDIREANIEIETTYLDAKDHMPRLKVLKSKGAMISSLALYQVCGAINDLFTITALPPLHEEAGFKDDVETIKSIFHKAVDRMLRARALMSSPLVVDNVDMDRRKFFTKMAMVASDLGDVYDEMFLDLFFGGEVMEALWVSQSNLGWCEVYLERFFEHEMEYRRRG